MTKNTLRMKGYRSKNFYSLRDLQIITRFGRPAVLYKGHWVDCQKLEDTLWTMFRREFNSSDVHEFTGWVRSNLWLVRNLVEDMA